MTVKVYIARHYRSITDRLWPFERGTTIGLGLAAALYLGVLLGLLSQPWALPGGCR